MGFFKAQSQEDSILYSKGFLDSINIDDFFRLSEKKSYFKIQTSYITNAVYGGRKDSLALPYFTPSLEYNHKSGAYIGASFGLLPNSNFKNDFLSIDAGYSFDTSHRFGGSIFANKLFYSDSSKNVQSNVKFTVGGILTYDATYINLSAIGSFMFGSKTDFSLVLSADHSFYLNNDTSNYSLSISPTLATYFGSTGFYQSYKAGKTKRGGVPPNVTISVTAPDKFQILSYEFSLPINYDKEKWGCFFTPTYAIAVNPVNYTIKATGPNGGNLIFPNLGIPRTEIESISNSFYADFGIYYKF